MSENHAYIGALVVPNKCYAPGVWRLNEIYQARRIDTWPTLDAICGSSSSLSSTGSSSSSSSSSSSDFSESSSSSNFSESSSSSSSSSNFSESSSSFSPNFACVEFKEDLYACVTPKYACVELISSSSSSSSSSDCPSCPELIINFKTFSIPDTLTVYDANDNIIMTTGAVSTGNDFLQITLTDLPCGFYICVDAPTNGTVWDLISTGCLELYIIGGQQNIDGVKYCYQSYRPA